MKFEGRIVLITGAASGIGLGTSERFINEGATVVAVDLNQEKLDAAAASLGSRYLPRVCDITIVDNIKTLMADIESTHGRLDTLVNNAAWADFKNPEELEEASYDAQMDVLIKGPLFLVKHGAKMLRAAPNGSVVNIASAAAVMAIEKYCPYGIGKAAILKFTEDSVITVPGIRHNVILPGLIDTPILPAIYGEEATGALKTEVPKVTPCGRIGKPEDIANAICFLASDEATFVNGCPMYVDGGMHLVNAFSLLSG
jgi:NAD(P)-dependent dehydrogenase (short-subunit alcohol dehydrogenase family)